jgi:hypothetical protein
MLRSDAMRDEGHKLWLVLNRLEDHNAVSFDYNRKHNLRGRCEMLKATRKKRPQPWTWAQETRGRRLVRKALERWKLLDAMWEKTKSAIHLRCVPFAQSLWLESVWVQ